VLAVDYLEVVDLRLEQSYDIDEAGRDTELDRYERRPFSDVLADLTLRWDEHLSLVSRTWFSPYLGKVTEHENALRLDWPDRFQCSLGMVYQDALDEYARQEQEEIRTWEAAASVELLTSWRLGLVYSVDMDEGRDLEKTVSLTYLHQCFDITVSLSQTPLEERVEIWVNLAGLNF
jgi:LPS-assembly protein